MCKGKKENIVEIIELSNLFKTWDSLCVVNLALGLRLKQGFTTLRAKKEARESCRMLPRSAKECERIDPHTPKGTPTLGVGVPMDSQMFKERL